MPVVKTGLVVLLGLCVVAFAWLLGQQQMLQPTWVALQAETVMGTTLGMGVQQAPLFSALLGLLKNVPVLAQLWWFLWLGLGVLVLEQLAKKVLGNTPQRLLFLSAIFFASLFGLYQLTTINFQLYAFVWVLVVVAGILAWLNKKTAPVKGDAPTGWYPVWVDVVLGMGLTIVGFEVGYSVACLALLGALLGYQHRSTTFPLGWQHRCVLGVRWLWLTILVLGLGVVGWRMGVEGYPWQTVLPPVLRCPPLLPEWSTWHAGLSSMGVRATALLLAFFPWHCWLWVAVWDLWINDKKGGLKASFFLDTERPALRLLSIMGCGAGIIWVILPTCWLAWGIFLLSYLLILADWLAAACVLLVEPKRFQQGFVWISLTVLTLGFISLVWGNYTQNYQSGNNPAALQVVQVFHALWCVLGGCVGLLIQWLKPVKPKQASIGLACWFLGWLLIEVIGVTPLLAWQQGSLNTVFSGVLAKVQRTSQWEHTHITVCETPTTASMGLLKQLLGHSTPVVGLPVASVLRVQSVDVCLLQQPRPQVQATQQNNWLLLPETVYYANYKQHTRWWGRPTTGVAAGYYQPTTGYALPTVLLPLSLPLMVPLQQVWVLVPLVEQPPLTD